MELLAVVLTPIVALLSVVALVRPPRAREQEELAPAPEWRRQDWRDALD